MLCELDAKKILVTGRVANVAQVFSGLTVSAVLAFP